MHNDISRVAIDNGDLSSRTKQQAAMLAQTMASMEQLAATVNQNADNARQALGTVRSATDTVHKGGEQTSRVANTMHGVSVNSQEIGDITGVIDSIAFQTNTLAPNAAIEATRAGEQERGFAVIAGGVRNLASRSAQAVKEIKGLIEESVTRVQQGSQLVGMASRMMTEAVSSVTRVNDIMSEVASASDE